MTAGPSPQSSLDRFDALPMRDPLAFELSAADRTEIRRAAAVQASVGAGDLALWAVRDEWGGR